MIFSHLVFTWVVIVRMQVYPTTRIMNWEQTPRVCADTLRECCKPRSNKILLQNCMCLSWRMGKRFSSMLIPYKEKIHSSLHLTSTVKSYTRKRGHRCAFISVNHSVPTLSLAGILSRQNSKTEREKLVGKFELKINTSLRAFVRIFSRKDA